MLLPLVYTAPIRGVKVVAEIEVHVIPGELRKFTWKGYGFKLYVPVDALPCSGTKAPVKISVKASIMGEFKLPSNFKLVSGVYWISCSERFSKPVKVSIQHCCKLKKLEKASSMCFVTTKCNQQEKS